MKKKFVRIRRTDLFVFGEIDQNGDIKTAEKNDMLRQRGEPGNRDHETSMACVINNLQNQDRFA